MNAHGHAACQWYDDKPCQFGPLGLRVDNYDGKMLCLAHAPIESPHKPPELMQDVLRQARVRAIDDLTGIRLPGGNSAQSADYLVERDIDASDSELGSFICVVLNGHSFKAVGAKFLGSAELNGPGLSLDLTRIECQGPFAIHHLGTATECLLTQAKFHDVVIFRNIDQMASLHCDSATFQDAPRVIANQIPQASTFARCSFKGNAVAAEGEPNYRLIRVLFAKNRARESEGQFYALEKRCHRKSLRWKSEWLARTMSYLYDKTSAYGQSYERALGWLLALQLVAALCYSLASDRFGFTLQPDSAVWVFTLAQLVKPFGLVGDSKPASWAYHEVYDNTAHPAAWAFATSLHSIASLALVALALLALRWRFRRE